MSRLSALPPGAARGSAATGAADILLHATADRPASVWLVVGHEGVVLRVQDGEVRLGDVALAVGAEQPWPMRQPLSLGDVTVAFGPADEVVWEAAASASPVEPPAAHTAALPRGPERWWAGAGVALLILSGGLWALVELAPGARAGARAVVSAGLAASPQAQAGPREPLLRAVVEVFRLHGLTVKAEARDDGAIVVQAQDGDADRLTRAGQAARRDLAGLGALVVQNQPAVRQAPARAPLADDPGKRITSVVNEVDSPYFVTVDGSRYFTGALLPSGHRVMAIGDNAVTIERDGQLTRLTL